MFEQKVEEPEQKVFDQAAVNAMLAEDRRKHKAQIETIQRTLEDTLSSKNLTAQEKDALQQQLEATKNEFRTAAEQKAHEAKEHARLLKEANETAKGWRQRFEQETIQRSLTDAAQKHGAFSADQIKTLLQPWTKTEQGRDDKGKMTDEFHVVVEMPDTVNGEQIVVRHTPESAVKRMTELPNQYGNLFRSGVVAGVGSGSGAGAIAPGTIDVRKLSPAQYMEMRQKTPEALGLRPRGKR